MTRKRWMILVALCACLFVGVTACSSDSDDDPPIDGDADGENLESPVDGDLEVSEQDTDEEQAQALALPIAFPPTTASGDVLDYALTATGGEPPYGDWKVELGELPPGVTLDAASGHLQGTPSAQGMYYFVISMADATETRAENLFGIRIGDPQSTGPLAKRAQDYQDVYQGRHVWGGLSFNLRQPDATDGNYQMSTCGDCAFQSGQCTTAMAFRHAVMQTPESLALIKEQVEGWRFFQQMTGVPGLIGRCYSHKDDPMEDGEWTGFWPEEDRSRYRGEGEYADYYWHGDTSKDQATGGVLGVSSAYALVDDEELRATARDFLTDLVDHVLDNDLKFVDKDGEPTQYGNLDARNWEGTGLCSGLEAVCVLAWLNVAYQVSGEQSYRDEMLSLLNDTPESRPAIFCNENYDTMLKDYQWVYMGYGTKWYNTYMAFENYWMLTRFEQDPELKQHFSELFKDTLWLNPEDETPNRRGIKEHNPVKTTWYLSATGEQDARSLYYALWQIVVFPEAPLRDRRFTNSENPDIEKNPDNLEEALYPLPSYLHLPDMVMWHRNPFALDGGSDSGEERTGCDYMLPYWMGRYYGFISEEW